MKYSPLGGNIWLSCRRFNGKVRMEIEDQGKGFTREDREKAFRLGQTLSAKTTGGESSTGFGLFIAKQIVKLHRGNISISDGKMGSGACVSFELPALVDVSPERPILCGLSSGYFLPQINHELGRLTILITKACSTKSRPGVIPSTAGPAILFPKLKKAEGELKMIFGGD